MTTPPRRQPVLLTLAQILACLMMPLFFFAMVSTLAAIPRGKAILKAKEPIPSEWEWVVPNHGSYYPWPLHGPIWILFLLGLIGCAAFIAVSHKRWKHKSPPSA